MMDGLTHWTWILLATGVTIASVIVLMRLVSPDAPPDKGIPAKVVLGVLGVIGGVAAIALVLHFGMR